MRIGQEWIRRGLALLLIVGFASACDDGGLAPPQVASVTVTPSQLALEVGETGQLTAELRDAGDRIIPGNDGVLWVTSDGGVASVSSTGQVTGVGAGTARVAAVVGGLQAEAVVTVQGTMALDVSSDDVTFHVDAGGDPAEATLDVTSSGGDATGLAVAIDYGSGDGWLTAELGGSSAPTTLHLTADQENLDPGSYSATVMVSAPGSSSAEVTVLLVVVGGGPEPVISLDTARIEIQAIRGDEPPDSIARTVRNSGSGELVGLSVTIEYDSIDGWLRAELADTIAPTQLVFEAEVGDRPSGVHWATVTVQAPGAEDVSIRVRFTILGGNGGGPGGGPNLDLDIDTVTFDGGEGTDPAPDTIGVDSDGDPVPGISVWIEYAQGEPTGWLTAELVSDTTPTSLILTPNSEGLEPGTYHATVFLAAPGIDTVQVPVVYTVTEGDGGGGDPGDGGPGFTLDADTVSFSGEEGTDPTPETVGVDSDGDPISDVSVRIEYAEGEPTGWLSAVADGTTTPVSIVLTPNSDGLDPGIYHATVFVEAPGSETVEIPVVYAVTEGDGGGDPGPSPILQLDVGSVAFEATEGEGNPAPTSADITSTDGVVSGLAVMVTYASGEPVGWLDAATSSAQTPAELELSADIDGLAPGSYTAEVTVSGTGATPATTTVTLTVTAADTGGGSSVPVLSVEDVDFGTMVRGGAAPGAQNVNVTSSDDDEITGLAFAVDPADDWLDVAWQGGESTTPAVLVLTPDAAALSAAGIYTAEVTVSGGGADSEILEVTLEVVDPSLVLDVSDVTFTAPVGDADPAPSTVEISAEAGTVSGIDFTIEYLGASTGWLSGTLAGTSTPTDLVLTAETGALAEGTHEARVIVTGTDAMPDTAMVTFTVTEAELTGLRANVMVGSDAVNAGTVANLDLLALLEDPLVQVIAWALYSDGDSVDVTNAAGLTTSDPLLTVDGGGVLDVVGVLVKGLTDPNHTINATYEGFTAEANLTIDVPLVSELPITSLVFEDTSPLNLGVGTQLPAVIAALSGAGIPLGVDLDIPGDTPGIEWNVTPRLSVCDPLDVLVCPVVNALLETLGNLTGSVLNLTDGVVSGLDLGPLSTILHLLTGPLVVDVSAVIDGVATPLLEGMIPID